MHVVALSGSPSARSRSAWLLQLALTRIEGRSASATHVVVRDLPAPALMAADVHDPAVRAALSAIERADLVLVATPIYKAAYSGLLKIFLDLLPTNALGGKRVLAMATGGSAAHLLALDYALKPVLGALGARQYLDSVYATDAQLIAHASGGFVPSADLVERIDLALAPLARRTSIVEAARC